MQCSSDDRLHNQVLFLPSFGPFVTFSNFLDKDDHFLRDVLTSRPTAFPNFTEVSLITIAARRHGSLSLISVHWHHGKHPGVSISLLLRRSHNLFDHRYPSACYSNSCTHINESKHDQPYAFTDDITSTDAETLAIRMSSPKPEH